MANVPETSTTLLRDLACDSQHARWAEFVARYRPMMDAYMREHFLTLAAVGEVIGDWKITARRRGFLI